MNKDIAISEGRVFLMTDHYGHINPKQVQGFFYDDVRHLSFIQTYINGEFPDMLDVNELRYNRAIFVQKNKESFDLPKDSLTIIEDRILDDGMFENIKFISNSNKSLKFTFEIMLGADFVDMFEIRDKSFNDNPNAVKKREVFFKHDDPENKITFSFRRGEYFRETYIEFSEDFKSKNNSVIFEIELAPKATHDISLRLSTKNQNGEIFAPNVETYSLDRKAEIITEDDPFPKLQTDWDDLKNLYERSIRSLQVLKIEQVDDDGEKILYTAAGLPWFMTLFGRDAAISAYQMLGFDNRFAIGVLKTLSKYQGKVEDPENEEEPGKILHEMRVGENAVFKDWVKFPYYGTIDATVLYIKLFVGLYKFHAGDPFFMTLKDDVLLALEWLDKYGDIDGDGYVEYHKKSPKGLRNQNWRDSDVSMMFSNGDLAETPIASADVQGYIYDVKHSLARIAETEWNDVKLAEKLTLEAGELKTKFNKDFWVEDGGYFALGLDKDKKLIDTPSSSMGHLLWSEIVEKEKEEKIVKHLMSDPLFSGWGVRTISKESSSYNPLVYHLGTVWPHDNSLIVRGFHKRGFRDEAMRIMEGMIEASRHFSYNLPELFSGYGLDESAFPITYPTACDPQAWAAGTVLMFLKTILGIEMHYSKRTFDVKPIASSQYRYINLKGFEIFNKKYDITVRDGVTTVKEST